MENATVLSPEGHKIGTYVILCKKSSPPMTKHDVGEDIEFPGSFLEAEIVGDTPLTADSSLTLLSNGLEIGVRVLSCQPLPQGSAFFHIKISAA